MKEMLKKIGMNVTAKMRKPYLTALLTAYVKGFRRACLIGSDSDAKEVSVDSTN